MSDTVPALLIQYGRSAFVGRFPCPAAPPPRGTTVVVRSPRGVELGTVLGPLIDRFAGQIDPSAGGELLRPATPADDAAEQRAVELADRILDAAEQSGQPITFLDCEVTLDARGAILHAVPWGACNLDPVLTELSERFGLAVRVMDVSRTPTLADPPEPNTSCGKPDCGTGEGGCGTGGCSSGACSRGQVKSATDLTAYFADLRKQMEASGRTPLN